MKAMNRFFAGTALAIALSGAGVAWGDSSVVGGNVVVDRPEVDTAAHFYLVDTNHPLNVDGKLDQWEIYAGARTPVRLVIYRQQEDGTFSVVGMSDPAVTPVMGHNLFLLSKKIPVKAGDFVGAYSSGTGSIVFNYDLPSSPVSSAFDPGDLTGTTLFLIDSPNPDPTDLPNPITFTRSSNRHYSIRVMGENQQGGDCQINIADAKARPNVLWPPNHKMVPVTVGVSASSSCDNAKPICKILLVRSNEPANGTGDGNASPDWQITGNLTVNLRADRAGNGSGRVYTLTGECVDTAGNSAPWRTTVTVPHDQGDDE